jgi:hypothetical protein
MHYVIRIADSMPYIRNHIAHVGCRERCDTSGRCGGDQSVIRGVEASGSALLVNRQPTIATGIALGFRADVNRLEFSEIANKFPR